jgi:hypothetical protein
VSGCATPSDAVPALRFSSAVGSGAVGLRLPGSLGSPSPPVSWGQVMNITEQACSWVAATKRLLWEVMATISRDVLHIIWVSLKKKESLFESLWLTPSSLKLLCFCFCFCSTWLKALVTCPDHKRS